MRTETSIIVIAYNEQAYVGECIKSLLNQTFTDFRLIIVNDGSTDSTEQVIKQFNDPRIIQINNDKKKGFSTARNTGLEQVSDGIVFFTDADCRPRQDWIENGLAALADGTDIIGGNTIYEYAEGGQL
jgi:glycosyltransferase involved in cell wall biosynthesis